LVSVLFRQLTVKDEGTNVIVHGLKHRDDDSMQRRCANHSVHTFQVQLNITDIEGLHY
jgi:hypothetical protein